MAIDIDPTLLRSEVPARGDKYLRKQIMLICFKLLTSPIISWFIAWTCSNNVSILGYIIDTLFFRGDCIDMSTLQQFEERHIQKQGFLANLL